MSDARIEIFTDGACKGNPGPGGWGALLRYGNKEKEINGYNSSTTNNIMELTAVIEALCWLCLHGRQYCADHKVHKIHIYLDSMVAIKLLNGEY